MINAKNWRAYLLHVEEENKKVEVRNKKVLAKYRKDSAAFQKKMEALNQRIEAVNESNQDKFKASQRAWDAQPWYKKLSGKDRPWLGYSRVPTHSTIYWVLPLFEPLKKPTIEDFLTWQLEREK